MRMLESKAVWRGVVEGRALDFRDRSNEISSGREACAGALSADQVDCIVLQIVSAGAGTLVGIDYRAPTLESPFACGGDRAVDTARARRGCCDDTTVTRVEAVGHLHHHGYGPVPAAF